MQLSQVLSISINPASSSDRYPTSKIQKGPVLAYRSTDLSGEGVGLGVPIVKIGRRVIFPGEAYMIEQSEGPQTCEWITDYELNLEERIALKSGEKIRSKAIYALAEGFAEAHKAIGLSRGAIERASTVLRRIWGLRTTFEAIPSSGTVRASYRVDSRDKVLHIRVDASRLKADCTEMILLNEQDGSLFNRYYDADGLALFGKEIGTWDKTATAWATLSDSQHSVSLRFPNVPGSCMFRGREVVPGRLSWAGVAYVSAPPCARFEYDVTIRGGL